MKSIKFSKPVPLSSWAWLYINYAGQRPAWGSPAELQGSLIAFAEKLNEVGVQNRGAVGGDQIDLAPSVIPIEKIENSVKSLMAKYKPAMILVILPSKDTSIYNCVKTVCDTRVGVHNVCVLTKGFAKPGHDRFLVNVGLLTPLVDEWTTAVGHERYPPYIYYFRDGVPTSPSS